MKLLEKFLEIMKVIINWRYWNKAIKEFEKENYSECLKELDRINSSFIRKWHKYISTYLVCKFMLNHFYDVVHIADEAIQYVENDNTLKEVDKNYIKKFILFYKCNALKLILNSKKTEDEILCEEKFKSIEINYKQVSEKIKDFYSIKSFQETLS